jgi:predicted GTPase
LSRSLKEIYCEIKERPEASCKAIVINLKRELEITRELAANLQQNMPIKKIIIIGCTGSGKSALANVISGTDKFIESDSSISETKETQGEEFENNGIRYNIFDTVGFGDTKLPSEEVIRSISDAAYSDKNGLSQVLFVVKDRFDEQQRFAYNSLRNIIFGGDVDKYVTIVRTKFSKFEEKKKCEDDKQKMLEENPELAKIINSVNKVIHVDNQSIVEGRSEAYNKEARKLREKSRKKILQHLETCQEVYQPRYLSRIKRKFEEQLEQSEKIENF